MTVAELAAALPGVRGLHFLNYAATAPLLAPSAETMAEIARQGMEPLGLHFEAWLSILETARRTVADAIGADPDEIAFTTNTSSALSLAAGAIRWRPGDRVLYPADEFPSNRYVWQNLAPLGVTAEPILPEPGRTLAAALAGRDLAGVRAVAFSAVSYRDGRREDVRNVARLCHERGIVVVVDAIQAVGAVPVDVRDWECDFLACGGQKWLLGPVGSGFLFVRADRIPELRVPLVGWASSRHAGELEVPRLEFCAGARRFEPGLPDIAAIAGLGRSVELLVSAGWPTIFQRVAAHHARLRAELADLGYSLLGSDAPNASAGIVTVRLESDPEDSAIADLLRGRRVVVAHRRRELRISAHAVTVEANLDTLLDALAVARGTPGRARARGSATTVARPTDARPEARQVPWRRALITGASRGLGEGIALELARRGCALTLIARDADTLRAVAERVRGEHGVAVDVAPLDLSDADAVAGWLDAERERLEEIDVLVNNAALGEAGLFSGVGNEEIRATFETNFFAPATITRALLPGMIARGGGAILNVVTSGGRCALPLFSVYAASKGALWAWSEALGRELGGTGIRVLTFIPPHMDTTTARQLGRKALAYYDVGMVSPRGAAGGLRRLVRAVVERVRPGSPAPTSPLVVGARAVAALADGVERAAPAAVVGRLVLNALAPGFVSRRLRRAWRWPEAIRVRGRR